MAQINVEIHQGLIFFQCDEIGNVEVRVGEQIELTLQVEVEEPANRGSAERLRWRASQRLRQVFCIPPSSCRGRQEKWESEAVCAVWMSLSCLGCRTASASSSEDRAGRSWRLFSSKVMVRRMRLMPILMLSSESLRKVTLMASTPAPYGVFLGKAVL